MNTTEGVSSTQVVERGPHVEGSCREEDQKLTGEDEMVVKMIDAAGVTVGDMRQSLPCWLVYF